MDQGHPVVRQQFRDLAEIVVVVGSADMLEHSDRDDPIVRAGRVAVVRERKPRPLRQPGVGRPDVRRLALLSGERDAVHPRATPAGERKGHAAPAAADIQHPKSGPKQQLGCDVALLGRLGFFEGCALVFEVGAGILQVIVEEAAVEVDRQVIVMADVAPRAFARVALVSLSDQPTLQRVRLGPGGVRAGVAGGEFDQVVDRAPFQDEPVVHISLARAEGRPGDDLG